MVRSKKPKERPRKFGACNHLGQFHKSSRCSMTAKTMSMSDTQKPSPDLPATKTTSILINIDWGGARMYDEPSTADGGCECVPC